jgi:hypothetical protein
MGKTKCAMTIKELLEAEFPQKYILYHTVDGDRSARLVRDLVMCIGLVTKIKESYSQLMEKFLLRVVSKLEERGGNHFVMIIDENQLLSIDAYNELLVIHNRLGARGISMTTVGFGQTEILGKRQVLFALGATNLVARFLCEPVKFVGCLDLQDLTSILDQYDSKIEYPLDSGCTYTQFFLPQAFASGFRIANYASVVWAALINIAGEKGPGSLPLEHIFRVIEHMLLRCRHMDSANFEISAAIIDESIDASLIKEFVSIMSQSATQD